MAVANQVLHNVNTPPLTGSMEGCVPIRISVSNITNSIFNKQLSNTQVALPASGVERR